MFCRLTACMLAAWLPTLAAAQSNSPSKPAQPTPTAPASPDRGFDQPIESRGDEKRRLQTEFDDAFEKSDWPAAETALRRLVEVDRKNFVPPYNLACVLAMQGKTKDATDALQLAVQRGFS